MRELNEKDLEVRKNPGLWFETCGRFCDEETRKPTQATPNILQKRLFEHYRRCQAEGKPCRVVTLKYRRAGSSTASEALIYMHAHNYNARLGAIGTDYRASSNMLTMLSFFGQHDDFPGWGAKPKEAAQVKIGWEEFNGNTNLDSVPWNERVDKIIATKVQWAHGSTVELYTAKNPESARSAGLNGYHATEVGRWPTGGELDAAETLTSMRNALPKKGFHLAIEESTADGASGPFHDTCRKARYPDYADWPEMHRSCWPLVESEYGKDLQFVFIFAAWFEDCRHFNRLTLAQANRIEDTLDAESWYFGEKDLIAKYSQDGPKGQRLGGEVDCSLWEQLAWRRGIIEHVCTKRGVDEFAQEYPSNPLEAFRSSGSPVFDQAGITALDEAYRMARKPEVGVIDKLPNGSSNFRWTADAEALLQVWEHPIVGCRYLVTDDPIKSAELVKGSGVRDCNSILVLRDGYRSDTGKFFPPKLVARVKHPNRFDDANAARIIAQLSTAYGGCIIVIESNLGSGLITRLRDQYYANLYCQENWNVINQGHSTTYGWLTTEASRRQCISVLQEAIRQQAIEILCPNVISELRTFIFSTSGKAEGASGSHDDDVLALAIGLTCLPHATKYGDRPAVETRPADDRQWQEM